MLEYFRRSTIEEIWHDEGNIKDQTVHHQPRILYAQNGILRQLYGQRIFFRQESPMEGSSPTRQVSRKGLVGGLHPSE